MTLHEQNRDMMGNKEERHNRKRRQQQVQQHIIQSIKLWCIKLVCDIIPNCVQTNDGALTIISIIIDIVLCICVSISILLAPSASLVTHTTVFDFNPTCKYGQYLQRVFTFNNNKNRQVM